MEVGLDLFGGTGGGGGGASLGDGSLSTVSKAEVVEQVSSEVSSYPLNTELDLGLGLSLGSGSGGVKASTTTTTTTTNKPSSWGEYGRILTAKDFPSIGSSSSSSSSSSGKAAIKPSTPTKTPVSGTKRAADSIAQEGGSANGAVSCSQVVGWPPLRTSRINILVNQTKNLSSEDDKMVVDKSKIKDISKKKTDERSNDGNVMKKGHIGSTLFVKVNMDGVPIGRKVDLNAHVCYETLAQTLDDMFFYRPSTTNFIDSSEEKDNASKAKKASKLLGGSSEYVLTYEDKDGDWMLVGDVPWGMFLNNVKRLRIMRTSEANGLAPRFQGSSERQRNKPI